MVAAAHVGQDALVIVGQAGGDVLIVAPPGPVSAEAVKKIFTGASGKTTVPMSRPSTTTLPGPCGHGPLQRHELARTAGTDDTADTARVTSSPRISDETSSSAR